MFQVFRSFFSEAAISGGLFVSVDATGYVYPTPATGNAVGTVEQFNGNTDSQFDVNTNALLPVNVRLFGPSRFVSMTGVSGTGLTAGALVYLAASGQASPTGTVLIGVLAASYPASTVNGGWVEVLEVNGI